MRGFMSRIWLIVVAANSMVRFTEDRPVGLRCEEASHRSPPAAGMDRGHDYGLPVAVLADGRHVAELGTLAVKLAAERRFQIGADGPGGNCGVVVRGSRPRHSLGSNDQRSSRPSSASYFSCSPSGCELITLAGLSMIVPPPLKRSSLEWARFHRSLDDAIEEQADHPVLLKLWSPVPNAAASSSIPRPIQSRMTNG